MLTKNKRFFITLTLSIFAYVATFFLLGGLVVLSYFGIDSFSFLTNISPEPFYPEFLLNLGANLPNVEFINLSWYLFWVCGLPYIPALLVFMLATAVFTRLQNPKQNSTDKS